MGVHLAQDVMREFAVVANLVEIGGQVGGVGGDGLRRLVGKAGGDDQGLQGAAGRQVVIGRSGFGGARMGLRLVPAAGEGRGWWKKSR